MGTKFDIRAFHDELLGGGALPLDVLDQRTREWVDKQKSTSAHSTASNDSANAGAR